MWKFFFDDVKYWFIKKCMKIFKSIQMDARPFKMDFEEFCAAAMNIAQLEGPENSWERHAQAAYQIFDEEDNRVVIVEDLAKVSHN